MKTHIFYLQTLSALHVGTGQGVGVVDLPIARAKATNLPIVPGSALKGAMRDEVKEQLQLEAQDIKALFGPDNQLQESHAGALAFGDANLLLLPIRSFSGTIAYATCPYILKQYARDIQSKLRIPQMSENQAGVTENSTLFVGNTKNIALEDLDIKAEHAPIYESWAKEITETLFPNGMLQAESWREQVSQRFIILPDDLFSFLVDTATEIRMRTRIERDTRIVKPSALWSEENLPAESVLWGVMGVSAARDKSKRSAEELSKLLPTESITLQIGGKHTVGRGLCRFLINSQL